MEEMVSPPPPPWSSWPPGPPGAPCLPGQPIGLSYNYPADGCDEIIRNHPQSSSGWYWVRDSSDNSTTRKVYCNPSGHTSCGEGVWMRIGYFDMGGNLAECPEPLERFAITVMRGGTVDESQFNNRRMYICLL